MKRGCFFYNGPFGKTLVVLLSPFISAFWLLQMLREHLSFVKWLLWLKFKPESWLGKSCIMSLSKLAWPGWNNSTLKRWIAEAMAERPFQAWFGKRSDYCSYACGSPCVFWFGDILCLFEILVGAISRTCAQCAPSIPSDNIFNWDPNKCHVRKKSGFNKCCAAWPN